MSFEIIVLYVIIISIAIYEFAFIVFASHRQKQFFNLNGTFITNKGLKKSQHVFKI